MQVMFQSTPGDPHGKNLLDTLSDTQLREIHAFVEEKAKTLDQDPRFISVACVCAEKTGGIRITIQRMMSAQSVNGEGYFVDKR